MRERSVGKVNGYNQPLDAVFRMLVLHVCGVLVEHTLPSIIVISCIIVVEEAGKVVPAP